MPRPLAIGRLVIIGDHLAAASRDLQGLGVRVAMQSERPWSIVESARTAPIRSGLASTPMSELRSLLRPPGGGRGPVVVIWWAGVADAAAGTPPLAWTVQAESLLRSVVRQNGPRGVIACLPPTMPESVQAAGWGKKGRRWLRRARPMAREMMATIGVETVDPDLIVADDAWTDPYSLSPRGYHDLATHLAGLLDPLARQQEPESVTMKREVPPC